MAVIALFLCSAYRGLDITMGESFFMHDLQPRDDLAHDLAAFFFTQRWTVLKVRLQISLDEVLHGDA